MKNSVKYKSGTLAFTGIGSPAFLFPIDHPSPLVTNTGPVRTSYVVAYDKETGTLETENTIYTPE